MSELIDVTRQLALVARAGLPLGEALRSLPPDASRHLGAVREDLERGDSLSQAVARYPRAFSSFYANMVEAAEAAERPGRVLSSLSRWLECTDRLERELRSAMLYPFLLANALGLFLLLTGYLAQFALAATGGAGWSSGLMLGAAVWLVVINGLVLVGKGPWLASLVPGVGRLRRQAQEALWARALGSLLAAGVALPKALKQASGVVWEPALLAIGPAVERGTALAQAGAELQPVVRWALQRGGEEFLLFAADHLEAEVQQSARHLIRTVATASVGVLGLLVLSSVLLFWVPFYSQLDVMGSGTGIVR